MKKEVPIIHLKESSCDELKKALTEVGAFYLVGHNIDLSLQEALYKVSKDFFLLPFEKKNNFSMKKSGLSWRGYFSVGEEFTSGVVDLKEGLYFGTESSPGQPLHGKNQWPNAEIERVVLNYMSEMAHIAERLLERIALSLGINEKYFSGRFKDNPTQLFRIFNYPIQSKKDQIFWGVGEHTDMGFLTLLLQGKEEGLEFKSRDGQWIEAPPRENSYIVNIGDMLEFWTHGILRATPHRVRNRGEESRLSFPFFYDPSWDAKLKPIEKEMLNEQDLIKVDSSRRERWDQLDLHRLSNEMTYGEFVWEKVRNVFPDLANQEISND